MKNETIPTLTLPKIGFGTWKIGGGSSPNYSMDEKSLAALRYALDVGFTHFDTAEMYAEGHTEELLGEAIRGSGVKRENLFITSKVWTGHLRYDDVVKACDASLRRLKMDYLDLYLIHWPQTGMVLEDTFRAFNRLVKDGKVKYLGVSNFNLKLLQQSQSLSETPIITNQVPYSLSDRNYARNGVLEYCQKNDILITAYEPLDKGHLESNEIIEEIARAHNATTFQIALAWVISQPHVITIPMSYNPQHIKENFDAANIELSAEEFDRLNNLS